MSAAGFATQGDGLALGFAEDGAGPGVVAREDEESGEGERDSGNDGEDAAGDASHEEEPSAYDPD